MADRGLVGSFLRGMNGPRFKGSVTRNHMVVCVTGMYFEYDITTEWEIVT